MKSVFDFYRVRKMNRRVKIKSYALTLSDTTRGADGVKLSSYTSSIVHAFAIMAEAIP